MNRLKKLIPTKRKWMQLYFAVLFNANMKGFISGNIYQGNTKKMCVPGINCYSCPGAVGACPLGSLQGSFSADRSTLFYVGGILLLYSLMFGRMICGWLCPFGLIQELLYKIKTPKAKKGPVTRILSYFKYVILVFFVFIVPITFAFRDVPLPTFCKYICPAGTIEGGVALLANKVNESYFAMLGPLFTWKFMLMVSILVGSIFVFRLFCRFLCPLGALYGLFNRLSFFGIKVEKSQCTNCNLCVNRCKLDVLHVGDQECISCGECVDVCPTKAIKWKGPKWLSFQNMKNKKSRLITRSISLILLIGFLFGSLFYYWNDKSNTVSQIPQTETNTPTTPKGNEVGYSCYGFSLNRIYADGVSTETINPAETGKITIINFWGTWCTPCVNELPYFDQIASEYEDTVSVITVHTNMVSDTAPEFIGKYYADSKLNFACDGEGEAYYTLLGGRGTYPYTIILDESGVITNVFVQALEYEDLKNAVEMIQNNQSSSPASQAKKGNEVGDSCYGFSLNRIYADGVSEETINPIETGKITIINFWGTWCTPCVNELPYFDQIASEYEDTVSVITVHTNMVSDTAPEFIGKYYADSKLNFACDGEGEAYYTLLGGRGTYPYTIIIDESGIITNVFVQALEYEDLKNAVDTILTN